MDCADRDRIDEAKQELHRIINDREMRDAIILIFANKQDLTNGMCIVVFVVIGLNTCFMFSLCYFFSYETSRNTRKTWTNENTG